MTSIVKVEDGVAYVYPDGFRPRRVRPEGWEAAARAAGILFDPDAPPPPPRVDQPGDVVILAPPATMRGSVREIR